MADPDPRFKTADVTAAVRAWHSYAKKPIFNDRHAQLLCGSFYGSFMRTRPTRWLFINMYPKSLRPSAMDVLIRAREAEESLVDAVQSGMDQYVIIGAGMDSFAFRRTDLTGRVTSFEVDHPVTQERKLERMQEAGLTAPASHHFVAADLLETPVVDALPDDLYDKDKLGFFALLGLIFYLTPEVLSSTMDSIAKCLALGTQVVFDYLLDDSSCRPEHIPMKKSLEDFVEKKGEPIRSTYSLDSIASLMADSGFRPVKNVALKDLEEDYRRMFDLPFEIPGIFGLGTFELANR